MKQRLENVSKFRIKKGEYEIEISSEQLDKSNRYCSGRSKITIS